MELRSGGDCATDSLGNICFANTNLESALGPGGTYWLLIQNLGDETETSIDILFEDVPDCPLDDLGMTSCVESDMSINTCQVTTNSPDVPRDITVPCPTQECTDGECRGNSCDDPIIVESEFHWFGQTLALSNTHNSGEEIADALDAGETPTCQDPDASNPMSQVMGREMVLKLPDLQVGQQIAVDLESNLSPISVAIQKTCGSQKVCEKFYQDPNDEVIFSVNEDGDYFVIIDSGFDIDLFLDLQVEIFD